MSKTEKPMFNGKAGEGRTSDYVGKTSQNLLKQPSSAPISTPLLRRHGGACPKCRRHHLVGIAGQGIWCSYEDCDWEQRRTQ